jgi:hypothetical protein
VGRVYDVFISYSHDDLAWVADFAVWLENDGFQVARDAVILKPGDVLVRPAGIGITGSAYVTGA